MPKTSAKTKARTVAVAANHDLNGTHTVFTVDHAGEGRHLLEVRVTPVLPSGDRFRHLFTGDSDSFSVEGLAETFTATVDVLQGDGRPVEAGDVVAASSGEIRGVVDPLPEDAVTPQPAPVLPPGPKSTIVPVEPTEEELAAAQAATREAIDAEAADAMPATEPPGPGSAPIPGEGEGEHSPVLEPQAEPPGESTFTQDPTSSAGALGAPEGDQPEQEPTADGLPDDPDHPARVDDHMEASSAPEPVTRDVPVAGDAEVAAPERPDRPVEIAGDPDA